MNEYYVEIGHYFSKLSGNVRVGAGLILFLSHYKSKYREYWIVSCRQQNIP